MAETEPPSFWIPVIFGILFFILTLSAHALDKARSKASLDERRSMRDDEDAILSEEAEQEEEAEK